MQRVVVKILALVFAGIVCLSWASTSSMHHFVMFTVGTLLVGVAMSWL